MNQRFGNQFVSTFMAGNNRMDGYSYDAAGNMTTDNQSHTYIYDAENRIVSMSGGAVTYTYDADGRRVEKNVSGVKTDYVYDPSGNAIAEVNASGAAMREELFAGGHHVGTYVNNTTYFSHADWLGTERVRSDMTGAACETISSLPFGDGESTSGNCGDPSTRHFTGKERDAESGLDYFGARYNSSSIGRFVSADPVSFVGLPIDARDPQGWNAYSYVRNNPLNLTDPNGTIFCRPANDTEKGQGVSQVCDVTDTQYVNASKKQQAAYDEAGYTHFDCSCDTNADKAAWAERKGNVSNDYIGDALVFVASFVGLEGLFYPQLYPQQKGGVVIGKMSDLRKPGGLKPGERELDLPNLGNPKDNWTQNSSRLREAMSEGKPIRDASANNPQGDTGFLRAERHLLRDHGWTRQGEYWVPPKK